MIEEYIPAGPRQKIVSSSLGGGTLSISRTLHEHYRLSGIPFFREYTDHSFQHSIDVFRSACDMISESAFEVISDDDLSVLLLACLVHDSGLHITEDVFLALTESSNGKIVVPEFDDKSWPDLWNDFLAEAKRFNAKKLIALFGDTEPVREPPRSAIEMSQRDKLLIGEFLRRHHPRFGHELIVGGVSDARGRQFEFPEIETRTRDIIGLVARSHGLDLRKTFEYIQRHYDLRDTTLVDYFKRTLKGAPHTRLPIIRWKNYCSEYDGRTTLSDIWELCFSSTFISYDRTARIKSLKKGAPIRI
jgi:hypothetical protein